MEIPTIKQFCLFMKIGMCPGITFSNCKPEKSTYKCKKCNISKCQKYYRRLRAIAGHMASKGWIEKRSYKDYEKYWDFTDLGWKIYMNAVKIYEEGSINAVKQTIENGDDIKIPPLHEPIWGFSEAEKRYFKVQAKGGIEAIKKYRREKHNRRKET